MWLKIVNLYHTLTTSIDILIYYMSCGEEVRVPRTTLKYAQALSSTYVIYYIYLSYDNNHAFMLIGKCISYSIIIVIISSTTKLYYYIIYYMLSTFVYIYNILFVRKIHYTCYIYLMS